MAWMRMMGADSVAYHEHTVAGRGDDPVARALEYYASRGETPMVWGGSGRHQLGVDREVDLADWRAIFAPGGARDPLSGDRLVGCRRPGMELVISPHKSIAELGVIGRAEDMHQIVDAERDATLAYLDRLVAESGGRRGRAAERSPTAGLVWAVSRHATTRAGDPQVHDHVLIANVVSMRDSRGGCKALDTAFLRDHLHAATAVGRMAGAAKAVQLGYGIEADHGRSGRLGGWVIGGIPRQAWEIHATRSAQIERAVGPDGSYRARAVAARATRDPKADERVEDLVGWWRHELADAGYPLPELDERVRQASLEYRRPGLEMLDGLAEQLLGAGGRLAQTKTFTRDEAIIAVAPLLHGLDISILDRAVERVLAHHLAVPLPPVDGAGGPVWAAASVLADETHIATLAERLAGQGGAATDPETAAAAVNRFEAGAGIELTAPQRSVAEGLLTSRHRLDVVIGVAGSGKTTTLAAVRAGFETAGSTVIGAATSGQAARTLHSGAGIDARTVASLTWRLDHQQLRLTNRHVLILDEAGMTADADIGRLFGAVEAAGAKIIVVGDYRQLDPVGPGGALEALTGRHPELVWTLGDNLRQADPAERYALEQLRGGQLDTAVAWYRDHGRIHAAPTRNGAVHNMVRAWVDDLASDRDSLLLAYRRNSVAALNRTARHAVARLGRLSGPELHTPDGNIFQAGDQIITLTPGPERAWTTSQRAIVIGVDPEERSMTAVTPDGRHLRIAGEFLGADRISHGYATTVHRAQGVTVDTAHVLADGGGRELAYVAMSRARTASQIHLVTHDPRLAADRLAWAWQNEQRQTWTLHPQHDQPGLADLFLQRRDLQAAIPADRSHQLQHTRTQHAEAADQLHDLMTGRGRWANQPAGRAAQTLQAARLDHERARQRVEDPDLGWRARRTANRQFATASHRYDEAVQHWLDVAAPLVDRYHQRLEHFAVEISQLENGQHQRDTFFEQHPDILDRIAQLDRDISKAEERERQHRLERAHPVTIGDNLSLWRGHDIDQGVDHGLSL